VRKPCKTRAIMAVRRATLLAPAKVNLILRVLGCRADGYHLVESLMVPVTLCDSVSIAVSRSSVSSVRCEVEGTEDVGGGADNLAAVAARSVLEATGATAEVVVALSKRIPAGAGLGGGSSDAAAVLAALPSLLGAPLGRRQLTALASRIGADVAFFLGCRPAWAEGIGDVLRPVPGLTRLHLAVVVPKARISTAWAYAHALPRRCHRRVGQGLTSALQATTRGTRLPFDAESISSCVFNDFERGVARAYKDVARVRDRLRKIGAEAVVMTGSGSAVVGLFATPRAAEAAAQSFGGSDKGFAVRVAGRRPVVRR